MRKNQAEKIISGKTTHFAKFDEVWVDVANFGDMIPDMETERGERMATALFIGGPRDGHHRRASQVRPGYTFTWVDSPPGEPPRGVKSAERYVHHANAYGQLGDEIFVYLHESLAGSANIVQLTISALEGLDRENGR